MCSVHSFIADAASASDKQLLLSCQVTACESTAQNVHHACMLHTSSKHRNIPASRQAASHQTSGVSCICLALTSAHSVLQNYNTVITLPSWLLSPGDLVTVCSLRFLLPAEVSMFGSRLFISAAFSLLWVFTPSLFSTKVRGFGLGISNASGRCG